MVITAVLGAGFGQHIYDLDLDAIHKLLKGRSSGHSFRNQFPILTPTQITYAMSILYNFGVFFIKLSITFQACYTVGFSLILAFIRTPAKAWWELPLRADHCPSFARTMAIYVSLRSFSVVTEVLVLCLPLRIVWGLMMPVSQRVKYVVLFLLGLMYVGVLSRSWKLLIGCEGFASLLSSDWHISRDCSSALISHVCPFLHRCQTRPRFMLREYQGSLSQSRY